jgi:drug/metabolite transporter (DMT)-like permease
MIGAVLNALLFGITPVCAGRAISLIGFVRANFLRLTIAFVLMGVWAFAVGKGMQGQVGLLVVAGAVGFGIGGLTLLAAIPRLGAPLTSLIEESGAAPAAALIAWIWYADKLRNDQILWCAVVLAGVVVGLVPYIRERAPRKGVALGIVLAGIAAMAQGFSLAATREAILLSKAAKFAFDVPTAAFQRLIGGIVVAVVVYLIARFVWNRRWGFSGDDGECRAILSEEPGSGITGRPLFWAALNSLFGPILGVSAAIWAQQSLQSGVVQSIVATSPLIAVPFARWLQGHKPPRLYYLGAVIAIVGLIGINFIAAPAGK